MVKTKAAIALLGLLLVASGCSWIYPPAGLIAAGVILLIDSMREKKK